MEKPRLPSDLTKIIISYLAPKVEYIDLPLAGYEANSYQETSAIDDEIQKDRQKIREAEATEQTNIGFTGATGSTGSTGPCVGMTGWQGPTGQTEQVSVLKVRVNSFVVTIPFYYIWRLNAGSAPSPGALEKLLAHIKAGYSCSITLGRGLTLRYLSPKDTRPATFLIGNYFHFAGAEANIILDWLEHVQGLIPAGWTLVFPYY